MVASKGLTKQMPLRMTEDERTLIETVQDVYGREGVQMSLNDTVRHLVRRAAIVLACTADGAREQLSDHVKGCEDCDYQSSDDLGSIPLTGCPEGVYLHRNYRRVIRAHGGTTEADGL